MDPAARDHREGLCAGRSKRARCFSNAHQIGQFPVFLAFRLPLDRGLVFPAWRTCFYLPVVRRRAPEGHGRDQPQLCGEDPLRPFHPWDRNRLHGVHDSARGRLGLPGHADPGDPGGGLVAPALVHELCRAGEAGESLERLYARALLPMVLAGGRSDLPQSAHPLEMGAGNCGLCAAGSGTAAQRDFFL